MSSKTDFNNQTTTFVNEAARGLETSRTEAYGTPNARTISTTWNSTFRLPATITESNRTTSYTYDSFGNALTRTVTDTSVTPNTSRTWTYTYDSYGRVLTEDGPRTDVSDVTTYTWYTCTTGAECGQLHTVTNALGQVTTFNTYDANAQPLTITDPNGVVTTLTYDTRQRLLSRSTGGETTTYTYYPTGLPHTVTLPDSSSLTYTYDAAHRLTKIQDGQGNSVQYTLDAMGNRTSESRYDPSNVLSVTQSSVYNTLSQLYQTIGSAGTSAVTTSYSYDANGNQTAVNAPLSRNTANAYDELNRLKQVTDPASGVTQFGYDANDNLVSVTDPISNSTTYSYNGLGDLKTQVSPATGTTTNTYDSGGNLSTSQDARGATATYSYDALNRVTQVAYGDQTIAYGYDVGTNGKGHLTSASDAQHSMGWQYDSLGRVTSKSQIIGGITRTVGYGYTNNDLTTMTTPSGQSIGYSYANGQITGITLNGTTLLGSVLYEPFGPVRNWTWGGGVSETRLHDTDGNPSSISAVETTAYSLDNAFRITGISNSSNSSLSWAYGYDGLDRLNSATNASTNWGWTYDANGNRKQQSGAPSTTYRANTLTLTYNNRGRMNSATGGDSASYICNALGQRIRKTVTAGSTLFVYDEAGHLLGEYSSTGALIQETVWLDDLPVATLRPNGAGVDVYYIHPDHLGTPRAITSAATGVVVWKWDSDPFGTTAPNQNPVGQGAFAYNLRYSGQYFDSETGLNYNYFRDYDSQVGRYAESDPLGLRGGLNSFIFVESNPIQNRDDDGLQVVRTPVEGEPLPFGRLPRTVEESNRWNDPARQARREFPRSPDEILPPPKKQCVYKAVDSCSAAPQGEWSPVPSQSGMYVNCSFGPFLSAIPDPKPPQPLEPPRKMTAGDRISLAQLLWNIMRR